MRSGATNRRRGPSGDKPDLAWAVPVMRVGFVGRGVVYLAVASFSLYAIWQGRQAEGASSTLRHLESTATGDALLALIALGMLAFAVWCAVAGWYDLDARGSDAKGMAVRSAMAFSGLVALSIGGLALLLLIADVGGHGSAVGAAAADAAGAAAGSGTGGSRIDRAVATVMGWPAGRWIVGLIGLSIVASGVFQFGRAGKETYRRYLIVNRFTRQWNWVLKVGVMGRGVVILLVGALFVLAAWRADPYEAGGVDEAFAWVTGQPYGWAIVAAICIALLGYAVVCFANAACRFVPKVAQADVKAMEARIKKRLRPAT